MSSGWLTESMLRKNIGTDVLNITVIGLIEEIDEGIMVANTAGSNFYEFTLPTQFVINNLPRSHAQALVYSEVIKAFRTPESEGGKGFSRTYYVQDNPKKAPILRIEWTNLLSEDDLAQCMQIIEDARWKSRVL